MSAVGSFHLQGNCFTRWKAWVYFLFHQGLLERHCDILVVAYHEFTAIPIPVRPIWVHQASYQAYKSRLPRPIRPDDNI